MLDEYAKLKVVHKLLKYVDSLNFKLSTEKHIEI